MDEGRGEVEKSDESERAEGQADAGQRERGRVHEQVVCDSTGSNGPSGSSASASTDSGIAAVAVAVWGGESSRHHLVQHGQMVRLTDGVSVAALVPPGAKRALARDGQNDSLNCRDRLSGPLVGSPRSSWLGHQP